MCAGMAARSGGALSPADLAALASRVCCGPLPSNCCNRQVGFAESDQPSSGPNQRALSLANRSERAYYSSRSLNAGEQGRYGECKKRSRPSLNPISLALLVLSLSWQIVVFHTRSREETGWWYTQVRGRGRRRCGALASGTRPICSPLPMIRSRRAVVRTALTL